MAEIVNLNRQRKRRARELAAETASANRIRHGRTGAERARDDAERERRERALDGAALSPDPTDRPSGE